MHYQGNVGRAPSATSCGDTPGQHPGCDRIYQTDRNPVPLGGCSLHVVLEVLREDSGLLEEEETTSHVGKLPGNHFKVLVSPFLSPRFLVEVLEVP